MKWISLKKQMPPPRTRILVWLNAYNNRLNHPCIAWWATTNLMNEYEGNDDVIWNYDGVHKSDSGQLITHWGYLPDDPKKLTVWSRLRDYFGRPK